MNAKKRNADTQEAAWLADEDAFVLRQAYKKAQIRVKEGRAKPVDWLAVTLQFVDDTRDTFDCEVPDTDTEVIDPGTLLDGLDHDQMREINKDLDVYISLERTESKTIKREFWHAVRSVCRSRLQELEQGARGARGAQSVSSDVGKIFKSKSLDELIALEKQITSKLNSDQPIDTEYWQSLLDGVRLHKSRTKLEQVTEQATASQVEVLRRHQAERAHRAVGKLAVKPGFDDLQNTSAGIEKQTGVDPESLLRVPQSCKGFPIVDETTWLSQVAGKRQTIIKGGFVPRSNDAKTSEEDAAKPRSPMSKSGDSRANSLGQKDDALFAREAAKDIGEDEEVFADEAEDPEQSRRSTSVERRKPRYFNRVIMGYEWNKYNQTHYDHDNPPPKVVQGYKFNIFYPDLIDKTQGPTFKIIREYGRRRGQLTAKAGEDDTCVIKFISGRPYEDIAFRIVDREWDHSARHERGFRSTFEGGVLQLHFQFRRMFYRK